MLATNQCLAPLIVVSPVPTLLYLHCSRRWYPHATCVSIQRTMPIRSCQALGCVVTMGFLDVGAQAGDGHGFTRVPVCIQHGGVHREDKVYRLRDLGFTPANPYAGQLRGWNTRQASVIARPPLPDRSSTLHLSVLGSYISTVLRRKGARKH